MAARPSSLAVVLLACAGVGCSSERSTAGEPPGSSGPAAPGPGAPVARGDDGAPDAAAPGPRARRGGTDVTFLVTADLHFGVGVRETPVDAPLRSVDELEGIEPTLRREIDAMNGIEGTPFPPAIGGAVGRPLGVLVAGDLTERGGQEEWARFEQFFGLRGGDALLRWPTFETLGNHDKVAGSYVAEQIARRHGGTRYAWDWQDLHVVCLGEGPDRDDLAWLRADLAAVGHEVGIALYLHFPLTGPYSRGWWFGDGGYRDELAAALEGYRVLGLFHGHYHAAGFYRWRGHDVYNVGSVKARWHDFGVVHVTDTRMTVAGYHYDQKRFWWWHDKPIAPDPAGAARGERAYRASQEDLVGEPGWDKPR